ncbi:MAG: hypothetical protein P8017_17595, partial [Deltaproteobacteria bacterium]
PDNKPLDSAVQSLVAKAFRHLRSVIHFGLIPVIFWRIYKEYVSIFINGIAQAYLQGGSRRGRNHDNQGISGLPQVPRNHHMQVCF